MTLKFPMHPSPVNLQATDVMPAPFDPRPNIHKLLQVVTDEQMYLHSTATVGQAFMYPLYLPGDWTKLKVPRERLLAAALFQMDGTLDLNEALNMAALTGVEIAYSRYRQPLAIQENMVHKGLILPRIHPSLKDRMDRLDFTYGLRGCWWTGAKIPSIELVVHLAQAIGVAVKRFIKGPELRVGNVEMEELAHDLWVYGAAPLVTGSHKAFARHEVECHAYKTSKVMGRASKSERDTVASISVYSDNAPQFTVDLYMSRQGLRMFIRSDAQSHAERAASELYRHNVLAALHALLIPDVPVGRLCAYNSAPPKGKFDVVLVPCQGYSGK